MSATRSERWWWWWWWGRPRAVALVAFALAAGARQAPAQEEGASVIERLGIDHLSLRSIGASYGLVKPAQIEPTRSVSVHADYGEIAPRWRVIFGVTYWSSRYTDAVVRRLEDSLATVVEDPAGDPTVSIGPIRISMIALTTEGRWALRGGRPRLRPYLGGGFGAYAADAEGRGIRGTFLESALDNIAAGVSATVGSDVLLLPNFSLGMQARYDLLSGSRFASLRAGGSYIFRSRSGA